jgi:glutamine synthetase
VSNRANGYRDLLAVIDLSSYRRLAWEKNLPFFLCSFIVPETGDWLAVDPRSALKMVLEKAEKKGWKCMSGAEFEVGLVSLLQTRLGELTGSTSNSKRLRLQWMKRNLSAFKL